MDMKQLHYGYPNNNLQMKCVDRPVTPANERARTGGSQDQGQAEHTMSSKLA